MEIELGTHTFKRQLGWIFIRLNNMKSAQVDLHKKRANNPTFCRIPKNERKIALHNFEFPSSKLYVDLKTHYIDINDIFPREYLR